MTEAGSKKKTENREPIRETLYFLRENVWGQLRQFWDVQRKGGCSFWMEADEPTLG